MDVAIEAELVEFAYGGCNYVARIALYPGRGGWGRVDVLRGSRAVGCGEFSRRGLIYLTMPIKPMRPVIERLIEQTQYASA